MNKVLVIIVSYNAMRWAKRCYDCLRLSTIPCDVITIDNGSTDGTVEFIQHNYPEVELRVMNKNLGFGQANNIGLQKALSGGYEYAYLMNQDAWINPDCLTNLISASERHPEYGILSPMQMKADSLHLDDRFATNVIGNHQTTRPLYSEDLFFGRQEDIYEVSFVMAAHWLITRKCLETVGGFSPTFFHYGEDDNYLNRTRYWKLKIGLVPKARAVHDRADTQWNIKKELYITIYTMTLNRVSNPLGKQKLSPIIRSLFYRAFRTRNKQIWKYAVRLLQDRNQIENNYRASLSKKAFLLEKE